MLTIMMMVMAATKSCSSKEYKFDDHEKHHD